MPYSAIIEEPGKPPRPIWILDFRGDNDRITYLRNACKLGLVRLPDTRKDAAIHVVVNDSGTPFFRRNPKQKDKYAERDRTSESEEHAKLKHVAMCQAMSLGYDAIEEEGEEDWRADALIIGKDGKRIAVEIQLSHHTSADILNRTNQRLAANVETIWFFGDKIDVRTLTTETRSKPFFRIPSEKAEEFVSQMVALVLNEEVVDLSKPPNAPVPIQPIVFDVTCSACEKLYSVVKAIVAYPNEIWGDDPGPVPRFLAQNQLFDTVIDKLQKRNPRKWFYRFQYGHGFDSSHRCPNCGEVGAPIKLSKEVAAQVPHDPNTAGKTTRSLLGLGQQFNIWGAELPEPRLSKRMAPEEWRRRIQDLLKASENKLANARKERSEKERVHLEKERERQDREAAREKERKEAADADRRRIWATITERLKPLLKLDGIDFDVEGWARGKIPFTAPHNPFSEEIGLKDLIERRSVSIKAFEDALDKVIEMAEAGGRVTDQLLGLPVEGWRQARLDEQAQAARNDRRLRFDAFVAKTLPPAYREMVLSKLNLQGRSRTDIAVESEEALQEEAKKVKELAASIEEPSGRRVKLQDAALKYLGYQKATAWTTTRNEALGGLTPESACEDLGGFDRAIRRLLDWK
tara:strand:+ start:14485 stop:16380 length:1896 start_codon:yes stop_codon:yes gene_type:complete